MQLTGEQAFHERPVDHDGDVALAAPGNRSLFDVALQHVVGHLHGRDRADGVKFLHLLDGEIRDADGPRFAFVHQVAKSGGRFGDRHFFVGRVQVEQFDAVGAEAAERFVAFRSQALGAVVGHHYAVFVVDAALGGDHQFVAAVAEARGG